MSDIKYELVTNTDDLTEEQKDIVRYSINRIDTMPKFKAKNFVGKAQITPYAELKQYLLELSVREENVVNAEYTLQKRMYEREREVELLEMTNSPAQKKLHELEIREIDRLIIKQQAAVKGHKRERQLYINLIEEFNNSPRGRLESGELIINKLDDAEWCEEAEKQHWTIRLAKQTAMDMIAYGRAGVGNMDAVYMLEKDQQDDVIQLASSIFVKNEHRVNNILSHVNESLQLGQEDTFKLNQNLKQQMTHLEYKEE